MNHWEEFEATLVWYFKMIAEKAGVAWTEENEDEIRQMVIHLRQGVSTDIKRATESRGTE